MSTGSSDTVGVVVGFEPVADELARLAAADSGYSAQLAAYIDGELVVDLVAGEGLPRSSITGVFSASKGVAAIVVGGLVRSRMLDLDRSVAHYWPEFGAQGKDQLTVRQLLSHQAGLVGLDPPLTTAELADSAAAAARLAAMRPVWWPGAMFGYHGLTIGILVEELVRRVTGATLQQLYERDVRSERDLDFYLGLPAVQEHRYVPVRPMPGRRQLTDLAAPRDSLSDLMGNLTTSEETLLTSAASPNLRAIRSAGSAAIGGVGSARGLAAVYAAAIGALDSREPLLDAQTVDLMGQEQVSGRDRLRGVESSFGVLFMKPSPHMDFGSYHAIGHDGAGGALGFADPRYRMGFGYIPQPMQPPGGADPKALRLSRVLRACAARRR